MPKHNNAVPNVHHRKDWQRYVRTWLNQPARKLRRQKARQEKVIKSGLKPTDSLRPIVRCMSQKYNFRVRAGRGFTVKELKACNLTPVLARTIGIACDSRRQNKSDKSLEANVERLKTYLSKILILPRNAKKPKKGMLGVPADSLKTELKDKVIAKSIAQAMPIKNDRNALISGLA